MQWPEEVLSVSMMCFIFLYFITVVDETLGQWERGNETDSYITLRPLTAGFVKYIKKTLSESPRYLNEKTDFPLKIHIYETVTHEFGVKCIPPAWCVPF